jgi:GNAT superfamily N-acetyltransferase
MPNAILIRKAAPSDAQAVGQVYLAARKTFLPYAPLAHSDEDVQQWVREQLIPAGGVWVATSQGRVIGMLGLARRQSIGWLDHLYLHPNYVGRGIGARLLEVAKLELGAPMRLYTFQANSGARRFYEQHGFRAIAFSNGATNEEKCPDVLYELI